MNFSRLAQTNIHRSVFKDKPRRLMSFNGGDLVPMFCDEVYPGDTYRINTKLFCRFSSPLVAPIFDNLYIDTFWFFVPNRLLWSHWVNFMGESDTPYDPDTPSSTDYLVPTVTAPSGGFGFKSLADYLWIRPNVAGLEVSALPFRAYNLIYNEWFRPEDIIDSLVVPSGDSDDITNYSIVKRAKRFDYFTSCLPWPQRGPSVNLPLGSSAPVIGNGLTLGWTDGTINGGSFRNGGIFGNALTFSDYLYGTNVGTDTVGPSTMAVERGLGITTDPTKSGLIADLSSATAATVTELRNAFQVQKLYERDARGGTRYTEILRSHFGVVSPDSRLQRPEYLGGNSTRMMINTVVQNSSTDSTSPQGNLTAFGLVGSNSHGFTKSFVEHGWVIGLCNVRCDLTYQQGVPRMYTRQTRLDYYWPTFAHLSEQPVLRKEIFAQGTDDDDEVFGYQERYAELRYYPSQICGELRSDYPQSLDIWHLSQDFENAPTLSKTFIENPAQEVLDRVLTVKSNVSQQLVGDFQFDLTRIRPLPRFGTPGLVDHF